MTLPLPSDFCELASPHYRFHFRPDSCAAQDSAEIIRTQEECFSRITASLRVTPDFPLHYVLVEDAAEVGRMYEDICGVHIGPINGFASHPDTVVAVYNKDVQCIGMHEDTHLIAALVGDPWQSFIVEGLAMYMDGVWWSEPNELWVSRFLADGRYVPLARLMPNEGFHAVDCAVSYPIAGAFTHYLIETLGMDVYLQKVYAADCDAEKPQCLPLLLDNPLDVIESNFIAWIHSHPNLKKGD